MNSQDTDEQLDSRTAMKVMEKILSEPLPDYPSEEDSDDDEDNVEKEREIIQAMTTGSRFRFSVGRQGVLGASSRFLNNTDREFTAVDRSILARSAKGYTGEIQKRSRYDNVPERDDLRRALQDDFYRRRDNKYKDRALPPIKENKFHLGPSKAELVSRLRERNLESQAGIESRDRRPLIPEENEYDSIPVPRKGTIGREIGKKLSVMTRNRRTVNGRPFSVQFDVTESGRPSNSYVYGMHNSEHGVCFSSYL